MDYVGKKRQIQRAIIPMREKMQRLQQLRLQYDAYAARMNALRIAQRPKPRSTKQALLVGINYVGSAALYGCINDVNSMKTRLDLLGFQCQTLTDHTPVKPTRSNILAAFKQLLVNSVAGDQLFFSYSGHGVSIKDRNRDEVDGMDEALVSSDMQCIVDDELKSLLMQHLKKDVTLMAMFDSCHSGTMLDLKYQYLGVSDVKTYPTNLETAGKVFMISGCMDNQTSADAFIENKAQGAMTWSLLESLKTVHTSTWRQLIQSMRKLLKEKGYEQIPQFASGTLVDVDTRMFI